MKSSRAWLLAAIFLLGPMPAAYANVITDWDEKAVAFVQSRMVPPLLPATADTSRDAAAAAAAAAVLAKLIPDIAPDVQSALTSYLAAIPGGDAKSNGIKLGEAIATKILEARANDERDEIEHTIEAFARPLAGGLLVLPDNFINAHRELIVTLAERYRLPAIYPSRAFVTAGGLLSYGVDVLDMYRGAASYIDRILKGTRPGDLPVQQPTRFELVINLKTAKALGLDVPPLLLARADEVIE